MAEEAIHAAGANKKIAVISHDDAWGPPSTVEQAFDTAIQKQGFSASVVKSANLGDPMRRHQIGLQPDDFFEAVQKAADAGAIVSFVGAPLLTPGDIARMPSSHPPILIIATTAMGAQLGVPGNPERLASLLDAKVIQAAIVNGASAAASDKTDATHRLFAQNYSILRQPR
ncbi:MAG TPA: hypothetical protein VFC44_13725 [Candidatus Saccharimonadales bacterium]|nr:hypothetical protein [Candidatus Saccharimonadales bacterium]